jgi:hypothetical protein
MLEFGDQVTVVTPATLTNSNQRKDETLDKGTFDPLWHTNGTQTKFVKVCVPKGILDGRGWPSKPWFSSLPVRPTGRQGLTNHRFVPRGSLEPSIFTSKHLFARENLE